MGSSFDDVTMIKDHDDIRILDGGKSMGDDEDGSSLHDGIHALGDHGLGS